MLSNDVRPSQNGIPRAEAGAAPGSGVTDEAPTGATSATPPATEEGAEQGLDRAALERDLLDELTGWSTRDRGGVFKTWHRHALSLVHLNVLTALEAEGPLAMRRLAEAMDVSDASATGIVDRMEKRGLVERRHATGDRRVVLVYRTEAGERVFRDMADRRRGVLAQVLAELAESDMAALLTGLRAIQAARHRVLAADPSLELTAVPETPTTG
jgi:DNA-binding MarR family transcriptional regulator